MPDGSLQSLSEVPDGSLQSLSEMPDGSLQSLSEISTSVDCLIQATRIFYFLFKSQSLCLS